MARPWNREAVNGRDFLSHAREWAVRYNAYDLTYNRGTVSVGSSTRHSGEPGRSSWLPGSPLSPSR